VPLGPAATETAATATTNTATDASYTTGARFARLELFGQLVERRGRTTTTTATSTVTLPPQPQKP